MTIASHQPFLIKILNQPTTEIQNCSAIYADEFSIYADEFSIYADEFLEHTSEV